MKLYKISARSQAADWWSDGGGGVADDKLAAGVSVLADIPVGVGRYGERTWGVWFGGDLLCVTLYLRGARSVETLVKQMQEALRARSGESPTEMTDDYDDEPGNLAASM